MPPSKAAPLPPGPDHRRPGARHPAPRPGPLDPPVLRLWLPAPRGPARTPAKTLAVGATDPAAKRNRRPQHRKPGPAGHRAAGNNRRTPAAPALRQPGQPGPEGHRHLRQCENAADRHTTAGSCRPLCPGLSRPAELDQEAQVSDRYCGKLAAHQQGARLTPVITINDTQATTTR